MTFFAILCTAMRTRDNPRVLTSPKHQKNHRLMSMNITAMQKTRLLAIARSVVARLLTSLFSPIRCSLLARTRDNPQVLTSPKHQKKPPTDVDGFFGAEDEIRTRATVSHTTPLAGEPLEPLGYFCMAQYSTFIQKL